MADRKIDVATGAHDLVLNFDANGRLKSYVYDGVEKPNYSSMMSGITTYTDDGTVYQYYEDSSGVTHVKSLNNDNLTVTENHNGVLTKYTTTGAVAAMNAVDNSSGWKTAGQAWVAPNPTSGYTYEYTNKSDPTKVISKPVQKAVLNSVGNIDAYNAQNGNPMGNTTAQVLSGMNQNVNFMEGSDTSGLPEGYDYFTPKLLEVKTDANRPGEAYAFVEKPLVRTYDNNGNLISNGTEQMGRSRVDLLAAVDNQHDLKIEADKDGNLISYTLDGKKHVHNGASEDGTTVTTDDGTKFQFYHDAAGNLKVKSLNNDNIVVTEKNGDKVNTYVTTGAVEEMDRQNAQELLDIKTGGWRTAGQVKMSGASTGGYTSLTPEEAKKLLGKNSGGSNGKLGTVDLKFNSGGSVAAPVAKVDLLNEQTAKEVEQIRQQFSNVYDSAGSSSYLEAAVINNIASGKKAKAEGAINNQAAVAGLSQDGKMYNMKGKKIEGSENWSQSRKKAYNDYTQYKLAGGDDQGEISRRQADYLENGGRLKDSQGKAITTYDTAIKNAQSQNDSKLVDNINHNQSAVDSGEGKLVNLNGKPINGSENWKPERRAAYNEYYQYKKSGGKDQDTIDRLQSNYINTGGTLVTKSGKPITAKYDTIKPTAGSNNSGGTSGGNKGTSGTVSGRASGTKSNR